jgi:hypothetical protein
VRWLRRQREHDSAGGRHRRQPAHTRIPAQRGPRPVGITDARTHVEHLMTDEAVAAHRHSGRYLALCGAQVLAASLAEPRRSRCQPCAQVGAR